MRPEDHLRDVLIFETCLQCPMHEKPDAKGLYWNFKCQFTVSIEVIHTILVKYQFLGATLFMFLNIMYLIVWKLESIGEKGKVWFNHMFLLVLKLLALLNNQLYFIILSPTDFATFLFWKVAIPAALLQNGYREHGKWWLSSKMFAS